MNKHPLALAVILILAGVQQSHATDAAAVSDSATPDPSAPAADASDAPTLKSVEVNAKLDQSRNQLSPGIGASQYVIDQKAIEQLPLGDATPLNQMLLQAPGVVQDSFGAIHVRGDHGDLQYRINGIILPESISEFGQTLDP